VQGAGTFTFAEIARSHFFRDCDDYLQELPSTHSVAEENEVPYTRELPTRDPVFVSTKRDQQLYYQQDAEECLAEYEAAKPLTEIETFEGVIQKTLRVNGGQTNIE
jgi:hypothetical protein